MDTVERLKALANLGYSSYAEYLRSCTRALPVGESVNVNAFGHTPHNARAALKQVAKAQGRKYRTMRVSDTTVLVIRTL